MGIIFGTLLGFVFGIIACWLFWKYLLFLKPNIEIAPLISFTKNEKTGRKIFRFKIVNRGVRQVTGITLNAWLCDLMGIPGGKVSRGLYRFPIKNSDTLTLNPEKQAERPWGLTPESTFKSEPEFDAYGLLAVPNHKIMITLRVADAISGTTVVTQKVYGREHIKEGMFEIGGSMKVVLDF